MQWNTSINKVFIMSKNKTVQCGWSWGEFIGKFFSWISFARSKAAFALMRGFQVSALLEGNSGDQRQHDTALGIKRVSFTGSLSH